MSQHLRMFTDVHLPLIGFVIFFGLFLIFIGTSFLQSQRRLYKYLENLPLENDLQNEAHAKEAGNG